MTARVSLSQQIEELERELKMRRSVYPRQIASGKMRQSEAEFYVGRLEAAIASLRWLDAIGRETIRQRLSY